MNRKELESLLPHRDSMLLLDEAELDENGHARGKVLIKGTEWFLDGHFPGHPVVPGVILCEMMAQSACVCLQNEMKEGTLPFYAGLDKVKFRRPVEPGDVFETECEITRVFKPMWFAKGVGRVGGEVAVTAEFSFALKEQPAEEKPAPEGK